MENSENKVEVSPKRPWSDISEPKKKESPSIFKQVLLWPINRVLDLIDIFKFDIGVGPSVGAVVRITKYGQFGYREMIPASLRFGNFGRDVPVKLEIGEEIGAGPFFSESQSRNTCPGELGAGVDLLLFGVYAGVCTEEILDFGTGLFFIDLLGDDIK
ncbi:MAG: hypothetical protein ACOX3T_04225 [Bdellovibrionota bacterium]